jgi:caa(3)-type oxidase subunit IV
MIKEFTLKHYLLSFVFLMIRLAITVLLSGVHLGRWNMAVSLTIAFLKATIVITFFMHAGKSKAYYFVMGGLLFFLLTTFLLTGADFFTRV